MRLLRLAARGLRNLDEVAVDTPGRFVVLHGENGHGKTNTLEAVWLLASLRGLRATRHAELIRHGGESAVVAGTVRSRGVDREHRVELGAQGRKASLDGKLVHQLADYFAGIRAIAFTPSDASILLEDPAQRRQWMDRAAFTASPAHLEVVADYRRCLAQKAATLRGGRVDTTLLDAQDAQLARVGAALSHRRERLLQELSRPVGELHAHIAQGQGELGLRLLTCAPGGSLAEREAALAERLARARRLELERRGPQVGPHRDELRVTLDGQPVRAFGSRGQVRSIVLALKLAELVAARARGDTPLFLLDDLSSELDRARTARLVEVLLGLEAQVWVSTTDPDHIAGLPPGDTQRLRVRDGRLSAD